jgi:hypothetical protein
LGSKSQEKFGHKGHKKEVTNSEVHLRAPTLKLAPLLGWHSDRSVFLNFFFVAKILI